MSCSACRSGFVQPESLFTVDLFGTQFSLATGGYHGRARETWLGAGVGAWDALTLGMHLSPEDKVNIALRHGVDPASGYYAAGQVVGGVTTGIAVAAVTGGLSGVQGAGVLANTARTVGNAGRTALAATDAWHIGLAGAEFQDTGEWSMRQTMAVIGTAAHGAGYAGGRLSAGQSTTPYGADIAGRVTNPVPDRVARVIPGNVTPTTLGRPGSADVFVTAASDIAGMTPAQIAERLAIPPSRSYTIIEFPTPTEGLASPVFRSNPGFVGCGRTAGGARELVIPNAPVPKEP